MAGWLSIRLQLSSSFSKYLLGTIYLVVTLLGTECTVVSETRPCPHRAYIGVGSEISDI